MKYIPLFTAVIILFCASGLQAQSNTEPVAGTNTNLPQAASNAAPDTNAVQTNAVTAAPQTNTNAAIPEKAEAGPSALEFFANSKDIRNNRYFPGYDSRLVHYQYPEFKFTGANRDKVFFPGYDTVLFTDLSLSNGTHKFYDTNNRYWGVEIGKVPDNVTVAKTNNYSRYITSAFTNTWLPSFQAEDRTYTNVLLVTSVIEYECTNSSFANYYLESAVVRSTVAGSSSLVFISDPVSNVTLKLPIRRITVSQRWFVRFVGIIRDEGLIIDEFGNTNRYSVGMGR